MAVEVKRPAPPQPSGPSGGGLGKILQVGGAIAGGFFGGPAGALAGAATGASLGGLAGGIIDPVKPGEMPKPKGALPAANSVERRLAELEQSPEMKLRESIDSLKYIPDDALRAQLAEPLLQAQQVAMAQKKNYGGVA